MPNGLEKTNRINGENYFFLHFILLMTCSLYSYSKPYNSDSTIQVIFSAKTVDAETNQPLSATISFEKIPGRDNIGIIHTDSTTGTYKLRLLSNSSYKLIVFTPHYIKAYYTIKNTTKEKTKNFQLIPIKVGQVFTIQNVSFEKGTAVMLPESYTELDNIYQILVENKSMEIQLEGHTDNVGSAKENMTLSEQRALAVKTYLVKKGIKKNRIQVKAFGGSKPLINNSTEENKQKNRRVEIRIIKK